MFYKLSIQELLTPEKNIKVPLNDTIEGAEDVLLQAINSNKRYERWYSYKKLPIVMDIARRIGKTNELGSITFARNVYLYQVENFGVPKKQADGQFDPPLIEKFAKRYGIDLSEVHTFWKNKLKGNWLGNRWVGRRLLEERKESVYQYPVKSAQIVGDFTGARPSDERHKHGHWGVDYGNIPKGTSVFSIAPGVVLDSGNSKLGGNYVKIDHGNGVQSYYAHNNKVNVSKGDEVGFNTVIAFAGATGNAAGSVHVHLEVKVGGTKIDPKQIIGKPVKMFKNQ